MSDSIHSWSVAPQVFVRKLNDVLPPTDKLPQRPLPLPLPLDADLKRKPMWTAMAEAFDNAPMRV
jgi:hypothetical protein